jgi:hypothetical protein
MRGLWTAELHRQQVAIANEIRQTIDFWTRTGMAPVAGQRSVAAESRQRSA